jgi:hypothetical protein
MPPTCPSQLISFLSRAKDSEVHFEISQLSSIYDEAFWPELQKYSFSAVVMFVVAVCRTSGSAMSCVAWLFS